MLAVDITLLMVIATEMPTRRSTHTVTWTLVLNQLAGECLNSDLETTGSLSDNTAAFWLAFVQLSAIRPTTAWLLPDTTNRVYFRPACVVDFANTLRDEKELAECNQGFGDITFEDPISNALPDNASRGIGMNNGGAFCSIRAYLSEEHSAMIVRGLRGGVRPGCPSSFHPTPQRTHPFVVQVV